MAHICSSSPRAFLGMNSLSFHLDPKKMMRISKEPSFLRFMLFFLSPQGRPATDVMLPTSNLWALVLLFVFDWELNLPSASVVFFGVGQRTTSSRADSCQESFLACIPMSFRLNLILPGHDDMGSVAQTAWSVKKREQCRRDLEHKAGFCVSNKFTFSSSSCKKRKAPPIWKQYIALNSSSFSLLLLLLWMMVVYLHIIK